MAERPSVRTIIYPVRDLAAAKARFSALAGAEPAQDSAGYVGYELDGQQVGLDPHGHAHGLSGPVAYWHVADIEASLEALRAAGGTVARELTNVGGTRRIAVVTDPDGNPIGLLQD